MTATVHPLDQLTADEITGVRSVLDRAGYLRDATRFVYVGLDEPAKSDLRAFAEGASVDRRVRVLLFDAAGAPGRDVILSLTEGILSDQTVDAVTDGQLPVLEEEFGLVEEVFGPGRGVARRAQRTRTGRVDGARRPAVRRCLCR